MTLEHLAGSLDVDLEQDIGARWRFGDRRAVEVIEHGGPFEEATRRDALVERLGVYEEVGVIGLTGSLPAGRPRSAEPELRVAREQLPYDRPLADPAGADDYEYQGGSGTLSGLEQRLALLCTEALETAGLGDADLFHQAARLDLAGAGERFER
jgi:hypothetical protein